MVKRVRRRFGWQSTPEIMGDTVIRRNPAEDIILTIARLSEWRPKAISVRSQRPDTSAKI
ncbi:hypothetical protein [Sphingobium sp. TomTYG45]|jgi:hypothetical protein